MTRAAAEKAAAVLAAYLGITAEELLQDAKAGRLLRNATNAPASGRDSAKREKRPRVGDEVYDIADPRHVGKIKIVHNPQIRNCTTATVVWKETGWITEKIPLENLRRTR